MSGVSLLLLLGALGYLVWEGATGEQPAAFEATVERVWPSGGAFQVLLRVRNTGGQSVQELGVRAEVREGDATLARASTTLSWLPAHSTREVALILDADPRAHALEVGFEGYEIP